MRQLSVSDAVDEALANNPDVVVARTTVEQAGYGVAGARGAFDPQVGLESSYQHQVVPVSSIIGGAASGRLTQQDLLFGPRIQGISPAFGTNYQLSFSSRRQTSDNTFTTLNPQFPTALAFNITQPLFRGRAVDEPRRRVELANRNQSLTEAQFRQRVMDVALQTELAYADLVFADQNLRCSLKDWASRSSRSPATSGSWIRASAHRSTSSRRRRRSPPFSRVSRLRRRS